ncbi:glutamate mutase L [Desulfosporosinus youngiae]|uniref:Uncharacterized protein n=1 Tax=Desulfosporosinus youngiae DSM 17734 TaxID=768710 RepID=H5XWG6_9FIRM|nr:glutamate mutase L [Desulfosporosinus youngiae]EHQ90335.1 hypothetical protein DesyoDRAFT_3305 [Desulfosporosinus youngiae DSM 17734]
MQKVLVAEIGNETTVVNAFGDLATENPKLLGQGISPATAGNGDIGMGIKMAVTDLEQEIGPLGSLRDTPFYVTSSLPIESAIQEGEIVLKGKILTTSEAIMQAAQLIYEEVGDVLVFDIGSAASAVYSVTSKRQAQHTIEEDLGVAKQATALVELIGAKKIMEHHGRDWEKFLKPKPETAEEIALSSELAAAAVSNALQRHSERLRILNGASDQLASIAGEDFRIRWIVGTGLALTQLPNGLDIMRESIKGIAGGAFSQEGIAMLLDKDCIMAPLGALAMGFRAGAWQLLRESFGVEN